MKQTPDSASINLEPLSADPGKADVTHSHNLEALEGGRKGQIADLRSRIAAGSYRVSASDIAGKLMEAMSDRRPGSQPQHDSEID